jgi:hypothetical protein
MQRYFGLRGSSLNAATIVLVVCPAFLCYGYNQAVAGGLLTAIVRPYVPETGYHQHSGAQQHLNSNVQGQSVCYSIHACVKPYTILTLFLFRYGNCSVYNCRNVCALSCIFLGDLLGRRRTIFLASGVSIMGRFLCLRPSHLLSLSRE